MRSQRVATGIVSMMLVGLAGCGGGDDDEPNPATGVPPAAADGQPAGDGGRTLDAVTYVSGTCAASEAFDKASVRTKQTLEKAATRAAEGPVNGPVKPVKALFVTALDSLAAAAETLQADIGRAGVPDIDDGAKIAARVAAAFDYRVAVADARSELDTLPVKQLAVFLGAATDLMDSLDRTIETSFDDLADLDDNEALDKAAEQAATCA